MRIEQKKKERNVFNMEETAAAMNSCTRSHYTLILPCKRMKRNGEKILFTYSNVKRPIELEIMPFSNGRWNRQSECIYIYIILTKVGVQKVAKLCEWRRETDK